RVALEDGLKHAAADILEIGIGIDQVDADLLVPLKRGVTEGRNLVRVGKGICGLYKQIQRQRQRVGHVRDAEILVKDVSPLVIAGGACPKIQRSAYPRRQFAELIKPRKAVNIESVTIEEIDVRLVEY